jgi:hypothetical protein
LPRESWHPRASPVNPNFRRSPVGFVAFVYGKQMNLWKPMFLGIALMVYPYFISDAVLIYAIGIIGSASLFFLRG